MHSTQPKTVNQNPKTFHQPLINDPKSVSLADFLTFSSRKLFATPSLARDWLLFNSELYNQSSAV